MNPIKNNIDDHIVVEVAEVFKSFKTVHAVQGISFQLKRGEFLGLLGPNGAGKTTLVEMIEGIQKPDKGDILIMGKPWKGNEDSLHQILGLSLQETFFLEKLRVSETIRLFASFYKLDSERVEEIIDLVNLQEKRNSLVKNLSGGQKQRLALGISLLNKPKILLLDEPTTGLDPNARREIWSILNNLKKNTDTSIILTTHYMEEAEQLCDYIIIVDHGKVLKEGTIDDLLFSNTDNKRMEFSLANAHNEDDLTGIFKNFQIKWNTSLNKGTIEMTNPVKELPEVFSLFEKNQLQLKNFECRKQTLDDLFIELTGRHLDD